MSFTFSLLGACEISRHDKSVVFATNTARALLAYLAAHANQPQQREHLAGLFYPDQTQTLALANMRSTLARVRKSIAEDDQALAVTNHTIEFRCEVERVDVLKFEAALAECATHTHRDALTCPDCAHRLQHAARLYCGDFLQGVSLANSQPFEEWLLFKREQLHRLALNTLHTLASIHESRADFETMCHYAERQLTLEPWREEAHLQLMRALVYLGRRTDALAQYDACRVVLHDEFGIEPSPEITAVYEAVRSNTAPAKDEAHAPASISWSKVPDPQRLFGRDAEAAQLEHWLTHDRSRVVGILGIGGVGKTTLAATVTRAASSQFETVIWYSLINAPLPADALRAILQTASSYAITDMPTTLDDQLRLLLDCLQQRRCLIVLDNLESILEASWAGHFRAGYEAYGQIMTQAASYSHESSLLFTSREQPQALSRVLGATAFVRMLHVSGVDVAAGQAILNAHGVGATVEDSTALVQHYSGNPLALQLVSHTISNLFGGDVAKFQREAAGVFGDIRDMLAEQFARLTDLEQSLMLWLAIEREPVSFDQLRGSLVHKYTSQTVLEALGNLKKRSLLESSDRPRPPTAVYALQNVVMEYVTSVWVATASDEVITGTLARLHTHALMKAQAKEYVRQAQMGLIVQPVAERVLAELGKSALPSHLGTILDGLRAESAQRTQSYAGGNLLNLALHLDVDVRAMNFTHLTLREAFLREKNLAGVNFADTDLSGAVFGDTFSACHNVAYNPTASVLAASTSNGEIRLWQADGSRPLSILKGHSKLVWALASNPCQAQLASGGEDGCVRLWDRLNSKDDAWGSRLVYQSGETVRAVAVHPSGTLMASAGDDPIVRLWNTRTGATIAQLRGHTSWVTSLVFSPDGRWLASCADDRTVRLWDMTRFGPPHTHNSVQQKQPEQQEYAEHVIVHELAESMPAFWCLAFAANSAMLAAGTIDGNMWLWNMPDKTLRSMWSAHQGTISNLSFSADGTCLASSSADTSIRIWDTHTLQLIRQLRGHEKWVSAIAFHPANTRVLASTSLDGTVCVWDVDLGQASQMQRGQGVGFDAVSFGLDDSTVVAATNDGQIRIWDLPDFDQVAPASRAQIGKVIATDAQTVASMAISPDHRHLVTGGHDYAVRIWDVSRGALIHTLLDHQHIVFSVAFHPDGNTCASGSIDQTTRVWDVHTGRCLHVLTNELHAGSVHNGIWSVAYSPNGKLLAMGHAQGAITLWSMPEARVQAVLRGHTNWVRGLAFNRDSTRLVSGSNDHTVCVWDVTTNARLHTLRGHTDWVMDIAFSPTHDVIATCSHDQTIRLWNMDEPTAPPRVLRGHENGISRLVFGPSGQRLASAGVDGTLRIWRVRNGELLLTLHPPGLYEGMNITNAIGLTHAQHSALPHLGAYVSN